MKESYITFTLLTCTFKMKESYITRTVLKNVNNRPHLGWPYSMLPPV